jgi:hypothetical protein
MSRISRLVYEALKLLVYEALKLLVYEAFSYVANIAAWLPASQYLIDKGGDGGREGVN